MEGKSTNDNKLKNEQPVEIVVDTFNMEPIKKSLDNNTYLDRFNKILCEVWPNLSYVPPIMKGDPKIIHFLYEPAAGEKSDTENWLGGLYDSLNLNIWVIDVSLETRTEKGKGAKPKNNPNIAIWIQKLVSEFSCDCFILPPIALDRISKKKMSSITELKGYSLVVHPSRNNTKKRKASVYNGILSSSFGTEPSR